MKCPLATLGPDFEPFLYASVGEEENGMMLSVLSAIARGNLDPWQQAAELAASPVELANKRLATMIAGLPSMAGRLDVGKTADRLTVLLPKRANSIVPESAMPLNVPPLANSPFVIWLIVMGLVLGVQAIAASRESPSQAAQVSTSPAITEPQPASPVGSDR